MDVRLPSGATVSSHDFFKRARSRLSLDVPAALDDHTIAGTRGDLDLDATLWERAGVQVLIACLLNEIGHGHEGLGVFPGVLHLRAQGPDLLFDLGMVFAGGPFALGWSDQPLGQQRQDGLKDLFPSGLGAQDAARLFHFAPFLSAPVTGSGEEMTLNLLPGWPCAIT